MKSDKQMRVDYPDDDVCTRVQTFLATRHYPAFRTLVVEVDNGTVTVSGQVHTYYEKQVALRSCQHVAGVLTMVDQIGVSSRKTEASIN